jgi:two-component system chemotaxis sensor kinase CheA
MNNQWDPELLQGFFEEAAEDLSALEPRLVELNAHPQEASIVHQAFRTIHSIKGNSGFFGIKNVNAFADRFENLLDHLRSHLADVNPHVVQLLLRGVDQIRSMLDAARQTGGPAVGLTTDQQAILDEIPGLTAGSQTEVAAKVIRKLNALVQSEDCTAAAEHSPAVAELRSLLLDMCSATPKPSATDSQPTTDGPVHWGETDVSRAIRAVNEWIACCERGTSQDLPSAALAELKQVCPNQVDDVKHLQKFCELAELLHERELSTDPILVTDLRAQFNAFAAMLTFGTAVSPAILRAADGARSSSQTVPSKDASEHKATVRVAQEKIDQLLASVGKLILTLKNYSVLEDRLEAIPAASVAVEHLKTTNLQFDEVLHALQGDALSLRRVASDTLLRTVPRMCTELAGRLNKKVRVEIRGDDIEADRSTLELLKDPLTHILRNSLDHGLETPEQRQTAGKPQEGTIRVSASVDKQFYTVTVEDDGRGIDADRVRAKAIEKGLVTPGQAASLSRSEVLNLIFAPGLSTAAQQTDVSGRGVGMDVVQRNIVGAGGRTQVESTPGKGTTLTIQIPLSSTLMVTEALLVDIAGCTYFLPNSYVQGIMKRDNRLVQHTPGGRELVMVNNSVLGLVHTPQALGHEPCREAEGTPYWIVVSKGERSLCLQVDHIRGIEEIVISELSSLFNEAECVEGAAFTREGDIALVLSVPWFLRCDGTTSERRDAASASPN